MSRLFARLATLGSFIFNTDTSHDAHAMSFTVEIASSHAGHPALKTSIVRFVVIAEFSFKWDQS